MMTTTTIIERFWKYLSRVWADQRGEAGDDDDLEDDTQDTDDTDTTDDDSQTGEGDDQTGADDDGSPGSGGDDEGDDGSEPAEPTLADVMQRLNDYDQRFEQLTKGVHPGAAEGDGSRGDRSGRAEEDDTPYGKSCGLKVTMNDPSHPFHGKTLKEVYDQDPDFAYQLSPYHASNIQQGEFETRRSEQREQEKFERQVAEEGKRFRESFAKDTFDKSLDQLNADQLGQIESMHEGVLKWMKDEGKTGITVNEAYILMNHKGLLDKAASKAVGKVVSDAQRGKVRTINAGKDSDVNNSSKDMTKWSLDQLEDYIDGLNDKQFDKFLARKPSDPLRKLHPELPWTG